MWVEEIEVASHGLDVQELHGSCCDDDICLPIGEPRAAVQPSNLRSYAPPAYRGFASGDPTHHSSSDARLIASLESQVQTSEPAVASRSSAPHPTPSHLPSGGLRPLRPCSSATTQSQCELLATRTREVDDQDVGLLPPVNRKVQQVCFEFYSKPMTAKKVMMAASAQPWGQKRTTLTQELIRRLLNCSKSLCCAKKRKHLDNYMQLLKNSGYSETFRAEIWAERLQSDPAG